MIVWKEYVYNEDDYRHIKKINREAFKADPEGYCSRQSEFTLRYIVEVDGVTYYLQHWIKGLRRMRMHYGARISKYNTAMDLFRLKKGLPKNIGFLKFYQDVGDDLLVKYISHEVMFECIIRESTMNYKIYYGDPHKVKEVSI